MWRNGGCPRNDPFPKPNLIGYSKDNIELELNPKQVYLKERDSHRGDIFFNNGLEEYRVIQHFTTRREY